MRRRFYDDVKRNLLQVYFDGLTFFHYKLLALGSVGYYYFQLAVSQSFYIDVEASVECTDLLQTHLWPFLWKARSECEALEAGRADAEDTFCNDACIKGTFGREVALASFRPCFDGIRYVVAQQASSLIFLHEFSSFFGRSHGIYPTKSIKGRAVPESFASGLS